MSNVANRRALLVAVDALVKTNAPDHEGYLLVLETLAVVASEDFGTPLRAVFKNAAPKAKDTPA